MNSDACARRCACRVIPNVDERQVATMLLIAKLSCRAPIAHNSKRPMQNWIPVTEYCLRNRGETPDAVSGRIRNGHWLRDVHARRPNGSKELWINLRAVDDWAAGKKPAHRHGEGME
jgi:hypothetical protein